MNFITTFIATHWDTIIEVVGAASILAAILAKLTKNKTDDKLVSILQKILDFAAVNPERKAKEAGEAAVLANPGEGLKSLLGEPRDID